MKTDAAVYVEAARRIAERDNTMCCFAICDSTTNRSILDRATGHFHYIFFESEWWGRVRSGCLGNVDRDCRVLALLLMAAMVEAGDA